MLKFGKTALAVSGQPVAKNHPLTGLINGEINTFSLTGGWQKRPGKAGCEGRRLSLPSRS